MDFATIRQSVPLAPLLQRYGVKLHCPIHRGEGLEAFHANLSRNIFHCFSCGAGGSVLGFLAAMEGCDLREAALRLRQDAFLAHESAAAVGGQKQLVTKRACYAEITARLSPHCSVQAIHLGSDTQPDQLASDEVERLLRATLRPRPTHACSIP